MNNYEIDYEADDETPEDEDTSLEDYERRMEQEEDSYDVRGREFGGME